MCLEYETMRHRKNYQSLQAPGSAKRWFTCSIFLQILIKRPYFLRRMHDFVHSEEEAQNWVILCCPGGGADISVHFQEHLTMWTICNFISTPKIVDPSKKTKIYGTSYSSVDSNGHLAESAPGNNTRKVTGLPSPRNRVITSAQRYRRMKRCTKDAPPASLSKTPRPKSSGWASPTAAVKASFQSHLSHFSLLIKRSGTLILPLTLKGDCSCLEERLRGSEGVRGRRWWAAFLHRRISLIKMK